MAAGGVLGQREHLGRADADLLALLGARRRGRRSRARPPRPAGPRGCGRAAASARRGRGRPARPAGRAAPGCARTAGPRRRTRRRVSMSPGPGISSTPASSACSTRSIGSSPASSAAAWPLSRAASRAKVVHASASSRSTLTCAISGLALPGSTTADAIASSTTIAPSRPDRARARPRPRSSASRVSSSKERTSARPHHVVLRAVAPADAGQPAQHDRVRHDASTGRIAAEGEPWVGCGTLDEVGHQHPDQRRELGAVTRARRGDHDVAASRARRGRARSPRRRSS